MRYIDAFIVAVASLALWCGCTDPEVEIVHLAEDSSLFLSAQHSQAIEEALNRDYRAAYLSSLYRSYGVGYGYNAFEGYADYDAVRDRVINLDTLQYYEQLERCQCLTDDRTPHAYQNIMTGEDSEKLLKSLSVNAGLSADLKFFQAEVKGSYASSDLRSNSYSFCTIHTGMVLGSRHLDPLALGELCNRHKNILAPGFRYLLEEAGGYIDENKLDTVNQIIDLLYSIYGSHLLYHADLGGRLTFLSTFERASLDSRTSLSLSGEVNLLNMLNYQLSKGEEETLTQTATNSKKRITAIGGDVTIISQMLFSDADPGAPSAIGSGIVEEWYKSVKLDFDNIEQNNTELIEIKLYPMSDFIGLLGYQKVSDYLNTLLGKQLDYEDGLFPRVYEQKNAKISTAELGNCLIHLKNIKTVYAGNEVVAELDKECIWKQEYVTCYPAIDGQLCHEGIACREGTDTLFLITWHDTIPYILPLCPADSVPYLYYSGGKLDIIPDPALTYEDCSFEPFFFHVWDLSTVNFLSIKVGPYLLIEGPMYHYESGVSNKYPYIIQDMPAGHSEVTYQEIMKILPLARSHYSSWSQYIGSDFVFRSIGESYPTAKYTIDEQMQIEKLQREPWDPLGGAIMVQRTRNFRYP